MEEWKRRAGACLLAGLAAAAPAPALGSAGTDAASFLSIPVGARPASLGGAYGAAAEDAYAPVWNPAGLAFLPGAQLAATHLEYLASIRYEYVGAVVPAGAGGLGVSAQVLYPPSVAETNASGARTGDFYSSFGAYSLGYGRRLGDLSLGAALKLIDGRIAGSSARGWAADAGLLWKADKRVNISATWSNIGPSLRFEQEADNLPTEYRLGAMFTASQSLGLLAELAHNRVEDVSLRTGVEWRPVPQAALRAGWRSDRSGGLPGLTGLTAGAGLSFGGQRFEYAWAPMGDLGQTHYFSLVLSFGEARR